MSQVQRLHHDLEWATRTIRTHRAVLILDLAGCIVAANQPCLRMCGYQRDELIGQPVVILLDSAEKTPERLCRMLDVQGRGEARIHGLGQVAKSGRRFRVDAHICPIRDDDGEVCLNVLLLRESIEEEGPLHPSPPTIMPQTGRVIVLPGRGPENPWSQPRKWAAGWQSAAETALHRDS